MDYRLVVVRGRSGAQAIELADGVTTLGRSDDCQLRIKSSQVSRKHCEIFEKKGLLLVKDLGSANGTFVNGQRIEGQRVLEAGDELTIGSVKLRVDKRSEPTTAAPAATAPAKPNDTAISGPPSAVPPPAHEEPADFDTSISTPAVAVDDFDIDFFEAPETPAPPTPAAAEATVKETAAPSAPPPEPDVPAADDAVADFLLDIKFDDDDA